MDGILNNMEAISSYTKQIGRLQLPDFPELQVYQDAYLFEYELKELRMFLPTDELVAYAQKALELTTELKKGIIKCLKLKASGKEYIHVMYRSRMNSGLIYKCLDKIEKNVSDTYDITRLKGHNQTLEHSINSLLNNFM